MLMGPLVKKITIDNKLSKVIFLTRGPISIINIFSWLHGKNGQRIQQKLEFLSMSNRAWKRVYSLFSQVLVCKVLITTYIIFYRSFG